MTKFLNAARRAGSPQIIESIADQAINAADTYVDGTTVPFASLDARAALKIRGWLTKTAAGVAAPSFKVRIGVAGAIADTARLTFVGPAQTAAVDTGYFEILALLRSVGSGSLAVLNGVFRMQHNLDSTGLAVLGTPTIAVTSAGFDSTVSGLVAGLSIDPGAAGVWTLSGVLAEITNT